MNDIEQIQIEKDIQVCRLKASSFPEGVLAAHQALHARFPFSPDRNYFGISRPENGTICYWSATEEQITASLLAEGYEAFIIPAGNYVSILIKDFMKNPMVIGEAFQELIHLPGIDPDGYCIEWYKGMDDVVCMVRTKNKNG